MAQEQENNDNDPSQEQSNWLESLVAWLSAALVLAAAGFLVYEGMRPQHPAVFNVRTEAVRQAENAYYVPLFVTNTGTRSAQSLHLEVRLDEKQGGKLVEKSELTLEWVPAHSQRRAVAAFEHDPAKYDLKVRVQGYEEP